MSDFFRKLNKPGAASLVAFILLASVVTAGSLTPPGAPGSTMNTLAELYESIVGGFDSTGVVADQNGSLIEHLKYIEENMSGGVGSDSLDFDEFVDLMTLDADTTVANNGFALTFENASVSQSFQVAGHSAFGSEAQVDFSTVLDSIQGGGDPQSSALIVDDLSTISAVDTWVTAATFALTASPLLPSAVNSYTGIYSIANIPAGLSVDVSAVSLYAARLEAWDRGESNIGAVIGAAISASKTDLGNVGGITGLHVSTGVGLTTTADFVNGILVNAGGAGLIASLSGITIESGVASLITDAYGLYIQDYSGMGSDDSFNIFSAGNDSANRFEGHMAIGNEAFIGDLFGGIPGQTLMSLHEQFTDLSTFGITAGTAHTYDLNPLGTATDIIFGEDVFVRTDDTNTEDFTGGIVAGRYYPIHLGSGTVSQMDGLQVQPQTDNGTVTQMRGILVSNNTTGTGDIGDAYAIYVDAPLGVGGITNNYGLFVEDQSGSTGDSFNIYSAGAGSLNFFEGFVGVATDSPQETLSVQGTTRLDGHVAIGNAGGIDRSILNDMVGLGFSDSAVVSINERLTASAGDFTNAMESDLEVDLAADDTLTYYTGFTSNVYTPYGNTADVGSLAGTYNSANVYGDGNVTNLTGAYNLGGNWGDGTAQFVYGSFNNACNCVEAGNITNAYGTYSAVQSSATGLITNAYDLYAEGQISGGAVMNNYGLYVADQGDPSVTNGYNIYSAGASSRNIFEGSASISQNFELSGTVSSNLAPTVTNAFDLGTSALRWRNIFASNASISNNLEVSNVASFSQLFVGGNQFTGIGVTSDSLDFDEFKDVMTLDATTTIASGGFSLGIDTQGYTPTAALSIGRNPMSQGFASSTTAAKLSVVRRMTATGVPLNAAFFQNIWDLPAAGGGGSGVLIINQIASSSVQNMTGQLTGLSAGAENVGTGTATTLLGVQAFAQNRNTGTTTSARGVLASAGSFGGGTVTNGYGVYALPSGTGSTITNMFGLYAARRAAGTTVTVSNWAGIGIEHLTEATNNTGLLIASTSAGLTIPAGNWGIYDGSPYPNYFGARASIAGNFGPTTTDTYDLGSSTLRWRDLYLASSSLHIGATGDEAMIDYDTTNDFLSFKPDGSTTRLAILDGGNIGIGTTTPDQRLDVAGNILASTSGNIDLVLRSSSAGGEDGKFTIRSNGASDRLLVMNGAGSTIFALSSVSYSGIVGTSAAINTTNTAAALNVTALAATTAGSDILRMNVSGVGGVLDIYRSPSTGLYNLWATGGGTNGIMLHGGNVGIGINETVTTEAVLDVKASQGFDPFNINASASNTSLFRVTGAGRVGIGTATPNDKLDVTGAIEFNIASSSGALDSFALCHNVNGNSSDQELLDCGNAPVADYMEMYPMAHSVQEGDIVMASDRQIQTTNGQGTVPELVKATDRSQAIGIVSVAAHAGDFNSIGYNIPQSARPMPLALVGRVNVRISMENGPISAGDPIALSSTPGIGAKAETSGFIIGRALEPASEAGMVLVFVNPTYWAASAAELTAGAPPIGAGPSWLSGTFSDLFAAIVSSFRDVLGVVFEQGGRIRATELCLDDVCVTKEQLREMLSNQGVATPEPSDDPTPTPPVEPEETPTETPDPESSVTPEPPPSPEATEGTAPSEEESEPSPTPEPSPEPSPDDSGL